METRDLILPDLTAHERRVREMMRGFGQELPCSPDIPGDKTRILRVRLLLEEVFELAEASGVCVTLPHSVVTQAFTDGNVITLSDISQMQFTISGPGDLSKVVDALSDISVVNTGAFAAYGVRMTPMLELTDANNLMKIANGRLDEHGKFQKSPDHPPPNYAYALACQGWVPAAGIVEVVAADVPDYSWLRITVPNSTMSIGSVPLQPAAGESDWVSADDPQRRGLRTETGIAEFLLDDEHAVTAIGALADGQYDVLYVLACNVHESLGRPGGVLRGSGNFKFTKDRMPRRVVYLAVPHAVHYGK